jgi:hypothetical protein
VTIRDEISAAVDAVTGLHCTPKYRQISEAGHAFVQLQRLEYPTKLDKVAHWQVYVMLPADRTEAEAFVEDHADALYQALDGGVGQVMWVTAITPQFTQFEPGGPALPTLVVEGNREQE